MASVDSRRNTAEPRGRSPLASAIILVALYVVMYLAVAAVERMIEPVSAASVELRSATTASAAPIEPVRCGRRGADVLQCAAD
jgi:hypothetical protein